MTKMENHDSNKAKGKRRGLWTQEEDMKLYSYITTHGVDSWSSLPQNAGLQRCEKSCRLRWINHLDPNLKKCPISPEEERLIISLHNTFGNSWSKIAQSLPGRTDNEIKNYWNCHIKKKLRMLGLNTSSKVPSIASTSKQDSSQRSEHSFGTAHIMCENEMETPETNEKLETTIRCYNSGIGRSGEELETEKGSQITAEEMDGVMNMQDYLNSLSILMDVDEFGSNLSNLDNLDY
ncbi:MYB transcription factor [Rhynchospora pubera]|uniref:MYB transcription factor n=1 Tax=Rhynchospora pubera TaxID=906938 RepID=A0AAV8DFQ6_9POAL|nr:MYB transcription factor [Rhynchospora pubera]